MGTVTSQVPKIVYPQLRDSADLAAAAAQRRFLSLNQVQLGLLSAVAFLSGLSFQAHDHQKKIAWVVCVIMFVALAVSTSLRVGKFDDRWFRCRAFAENFKSIVWRYVMSSHDTPDMNATKYLDELQQLRKRLPDLQREFALYSGSGHLVTDWMRISHALPIAEKVKLYREFRLEDQAIWYASKAKHNSKLETRWFWIVFCVEFGVIVFSAVQAWQLMTFSPVSGVAALGTAMIAWSQIKRFSDLGTSYAIAAGDLRCISEIHRSVTTQAELDLMVLEVETAVSREHSMWLARRMFTC
jgi:hypothetical protein